MVLAVDVDPGVLVDHGPWLPGYVREALLADADRRRRGVHHTSPGVAATVVAMAVDEAAVDDETIIGDPAVGGGAFLLTACEILTGSRRARIARVVGCDIDPLAVAVTVAALELWADGAALPAGSIRVADFLQPSPFSRRPDVVVGNPPFLSQLRGGSVRSDVMRRALRTRWPGVGGYVDDAAAFLLAAVDAVGDGGVVALMQPASFLSARDAQGVRARLAAVAPLVALWVDGERRFDAAVDTVAPVVRKGGVPGEIRRVVGVPGVAAAPARGPDASSWAPLIADISGTPALDPGELTIDGTLGGVAVITSGFRDQFYGLRGAVSDDVSGRHRLVTSGLIDPIQLLWGARSCRFDRQRWAHPVVDPQAVAPGIRSWVSRRLVPKLLVASQTKVVEVAVDPDGHCVPCTPVVSVEPKSCAPSLWHLAAALSSPVVAALIVQGAAGSALSRDAVRISAPRMAALPLPAPGPAWDRAAEAAHGMYDSPSRAQLGAVARHSLAAYGVADREDLFEWWEQRLPVVKPG